jgi:hypothetical protein
MRILDAEGSVVHDTYIENLAISLVRSSVDASHAIVTGAIGLTLLIKGLHPVWKNYAYKNANTTENIAEDDKKKTIRQRLVTLWRFIKTVFQSTDSDITLSHCLWCGGIAGLGM